MQSPKKERTKLQDKLNSTRQKPTVIKIPSPLEAERKARQLERKKFNAVINKLTTMLREKNQLNEVYKSSINTLYAQVCTFKVERQKSIQLQESYNVLNEQFKDLLKYSSALGRMLLRSDLTGEEAIDRDIIKKMNLLQKAFSFN